MVWVDFLSTTEINLGILCVSLPMLGTIYHRVFKRAGASRLGNSSPSGGHRYKSEQSGSGASRSKPPRGQDTIALDDIYAPDMDLHNETVVSAARPDQREVSSLDGSETSLSPLPKPSGPGAGEGIRVQTRWEIRQG